MTSTLSFPLIFYTACSLPDCCATSRECLGKGAMQQTLFYPKSLNPPAFSSLASYLLLSSFEVKPSFITLWFHLFQPVRLTLLHIFVSGLSLQLQRSRHPLSLLKLTSPGTSLSFLPPTGLPTHPSIHSFSILSNSFIQKIFIMCVLYIAGTVLGPREAAVYKVYALSHGA